MIPNTVTSVSNNTGMKSTQFTVDNTPIAFKVLSTSLYSDKPKAILRELICNAQDANIAAGNPDTPVEITLPSMLDEYLIISDSGTGMSEEFLNEGYSRLFHSTKRESNEFTGMFGIGRLSAFSLVDSYTIETTHEGTRITAYAYVDNHVPSVTIVSKEPSVAPSGTSIKIPFSSSERTKLESICFNLFQYWDVPPKSDGIPIPQATKLSHTNDEDLEYYIVRDTRYGYLYDDRTLLPLIFPKVLVGGIPYDVPKEMYEINTKIAAHADRLVGEMFVLKDLIGTSHLERNTFILNIPIGDIELSPSREKVETNEATAMFLLKKFHEIGKVLQDSMQAQIECAHADLEALADVYLNSTYMAFEDALRVYKDDHESILEFAKNQAAKFKQYIAENNQTKAKHLVLGKDCFQFVEQSQSYNDRYFRLYSAIFDRTWGYTTLNNTYQRYYPTAKKSKWGTKSTVEAFLHNGRIAAIDSSDPLGSKVIRDMRILIEKLQDDEDIEVVYQHDGKDTAEVKEFFDDYLEVEVVDIDYEDALDYIRTNRKRNTTASVNRSLDKPFSHGYTINQFYDNVSNYPDVKNVVIQVSTGTTSRVANLEAFSRKLSNYVSQFNKTQVYMSPAKEPKNKRYTKFQEGVSNLITIDLTQESRWLGTVTEQRYYYQLLEFITGDDAKTFKLVHFNLGLISQWNMSHAYSHIFTLPMRNLYRLLFTKNQIKIIGAHTQGFAHYLQHLHRSNVITHEQNSVPKYNNSTQDALRLYAKSGYVDKRVLFESVLQQRAKFYTELKQKKEDKNANTAPTNP